MFILDNPYVSDVIKDFLLVSQSPVLENEFTQENLSQQYHLISLEGAKPLLESNDYRWIYTNSENALTWLYQTLNPEHRLLRSISLFKNKCRFREETRSLFPEITFMEISADELPSLSYEKVGKPFIVKPTIGFLSAGVYRINNEKEWLEVRTKILRETEVASRAFPNDVINHQSFLVESIIEGEEFAIDAYIDDQNSPVILNILHHRFRDKQDMSDRLYVASAEIINRYLGKLEAFISSLATIGDFKGMPLHIEVRIDSEGRILPIEVNPLRFAGWCSTDIAYYAYGVNVYEYFDQRKKPNWEKLLEGKEDDCFALAVIEKNKQLTPTQYFDYQNFQKQFPSIIELRRMDYRKFSLYAFAFLQVVPADLEQLEQLLNVNTDDFISEK